MKNLKAFIVKAALLIFFVALTYLPKPIYLLATGKYKNELNGGEVYRAIDKSKKQVIRVKKLLIGDSVADQLYSHRNNNDTVYSLTCNQAISLVGHYLLLQNFFSANNHFKNSEVILIYHPNSFKNNLDQVFTYHYFLKPFYTCEYKENFSEKVNEQISKIPGYRYSQFPTVKTKNWSPDFVSSDTKNNRMMSSISEEYLKKIQNLCAQHQTNLKIVSPFVNEIFKDSISEYKNQILNTSNFGGIFENYFKNMVFLPDSIFMDDNIHFKKEKAVTLGKNPLNL